MARSTVLGRTGSAQPRSGSTVLGASAPSQPTTPTMPIEQAIAQYQAQNAASVDAFSGIVPYLSQQGYQVAYATHGPNGSLRSDDAIVSANGTVYDLLIDRESPNPRWAVNNAGTYDPTRPVMGADGTASSYADWSQSVGGTASPRTPTGPRGAPPPHNGNPNDAPVVGQAVPRGSQATNPYAAARNAQSRIRQQAQRTGRSSTILAGYDRTPPLTRAATVLGA